MGAPVLAPIIQKSAAANESSSVFFYIIFTNFSARFADPESQGQTTPGNFLCVFVNGIFIITRFVAWGTQFWNFEGCVEEKTV
jgi:hypothetical protein